MALNNISATALLTAALVAILAFSLVTTYQWFYFPPPMAGIVIGSLVYYFCMKALKGAPRKRAVAVYVLFSLAFLVLLPFCFWFGGALGGYFGKFVDEVQVLRYFIFYVTMFGCIAIAGTVLVFFCNWVGKIGSAGGITQI